MYVMGQGQYTSNCEAAELNPSTRPPQRRRALSGCRQLAPDFAVGRAAGPALAAGQAQAAQGVGWVRWCWVWGEGYIELIA